MEPKVYYISKIDNTSTPNVVYIGKAKPFTKDDQAGWQIKKIDKTEISGLFAQGKSEFNQKWDDRLTLEYS